MSLINEALKKAQRARNQEGSASAEGTGTPVAKRSQPKSANSTLLIVAGGVVLAVISMVLTALWLTRTPESALVAAKPAPVASSSSKNEAPSVVMPVITPVANPTASPSPTDVVASVSSVAPDPASVPASKAAHSVAPAPAAAVVPAPANPAQPQATAAPATVQAPVTPPKPDERVHKFVEALRVTGIRSSGTDSKVLMNDRVYRVNDIIDRALEVRLTKVSADSLTFTDANGATYVKFF